MNTQQLECFICVADKLNFTKAAEELYLSTPTVSHHIKSLEEELNVKLFIRTSKIVKLTEMGNLFYNDAKEILSRIELSQKKIKDTQLKNISYLKIGCTSNTELDSLKPVLLKLRKSFPNVYPLVFVEDYFKLKTMFNDNHLDVMLGTKEMTKGMENCAFHRLRKVMSYALISLDSSLCKKDEITFADLSSSILITLNPKFIPFHCGSRLQEKIILHAQDHFDVVCESDHTSILLASCGYGVAILPEYTLPKLSGDICIRPIVDQVLLDYGITYHQKASEKYIQFFVKNF